MKPPSIFRIELISIDDNTLDTVLSRLYSIVLSTNLPMMKCSSYIDRGKDILLSRLGSNIWAEATHIYIEEQYNEDAWKDMVSLYYVHTFPHISTRTMRVHLFRWSKDYIDISLDEKSSGNATFHYKDESVEDSYLGYFNLRPVNNPSSILSFVMPNYRNVQVRTDDSMMVNMLTYSRPVHICGITLNTKVFPFFSGEAIVAVCAHCSLIMLSRYIYRKMGFSEINLKDICAVDQQGIYPSYGLTLKNILEIFTNNHVFFRAYTGQEAAYNGSGSYSFEMLRDIVFSFLDSKIPVLLAFDSHVILLCGTSDNYPNHDRYIAVYDDSGAFISKVTESDSDYTSYITSVTWNQIWSLGFKRPDFEIHAIAPMFPRVSLDYPALCSLLSNDEVFSCNENKQRKKQKKRKKEAPSIERTLLLDCNQTKALLLEIANSLSYSVERIINPISTEDQDLHIYNALLLSIIEHFLHSDTLHYYWWVEFSSSSKNAYEYMVVNTVKTASLHITEYSINFADFDPEVLAIAHQHAKQDGYEKELKEWIERSQPYILLLFQTSERISEWLAGQS